MERCKECEWDEYRPVKQCNLCAECEMPCPELCQKCGNERARYENYYMSFLCDYCYEQI